MRSLLRGSFRPASSTWLGGGQPLPFSAVADPERVAFQAFGLERTSWAALLRPGVLLGYLRLVWRGWRPRRARQGEDVLQLGGDFVLDRDGRLAYAYRSADATEQPAVAVLLQAGQRLQA
jgi:hypothetical protein